MPGPWNALAPWARSAIVAGVALSVLVGALIVRSGGDGEAALAPTGEDEKQIVVGEIDRPAEPVDPGPGVEVAPDGVTLQPTPEPRPAANILPPDGAPTPAPIPFASNHPGVSELVFVVVAGSDARPGEDVARTRADSVHVLAINPGLGAGTIVGIPRDAWVDIPGHGKGKVNSALAIGGPQLLGQTVAQLTGMPVRWYVLTGFTGLTRLVDDLGGLDLYVTRRMNDKNSGARFDRGWHRFHGDEVLAFSRNRKDTEFGDFSRSANHGYVMLATLAKMRAEIGDDGGLARWLDALRNHVRLDVGMAELVALGVTARRTDPRRVANVVASGTVGRAGGQSVVFLDDDARAMFADMADDGVLRSPPPPYGPPGWSPEPTTTTTTSSTSTVPNTTTTVPTTLVPPSSTTTSTSTIPTDPSTSTTSQPTSTVPVN